jgi:SulP family sulfate permease
LVALLATTALAHLLAWPVETIGTRFGDVPNRLAAPHLPNVAWVDLGPLLRPALAIAILAGIESLLSAVVADGMTGTRHRSNMELVGQGVANVVSPIFGGIPATGAIARTATNIKNGGRTPVSGMVHAATLLLIMLFFGKWAVLVPMASLAAILVVVAYSMSEWRLFKKLLRAPKSDVAVLVATFVLTVAVDLMVAIEVGVVMAALLFMNRMASVTEAGFLKGGELGDDEEEVSRTRRVSAEEVPEGVEVFQITGPFFFGAVDKFKNAMARIEKPPRILVLRMRAVTAIDSTGLYILEEMVKGAKDAGTVVLMSGVRPQPIAAMRKSGLLAMVGEENVCANVDAALARARGIGEGK